MAGARTLGWAQRRVASAATAGRLQASTDTSVDPINTLALATDRAAGVVEVTAGVPISIRWGGVMGSGVGGSPTNTLVWSMAAVYELGISLWEAASSDTVTDVAPALGSTVDRTITFTPTHTGTIRLVVDVNITITSTGGAFARYNTDVGQFGSNPELFPAGVTALSDTPGLVRCGCTLSSLTVNGMTGGSAAYPDSVSNTIVTSHAPTVADGTYAVSWRDSTTHAPFATTTLPAGTTTSITDPGRTIDNTNPIASTNTEYLLTPSNSPLSTANGGAALPWIHFVAVPATPGTVTRTNDAAGNAVAVTFNGAYTADPRCPFIHEFQINDPVYGTPPMSKNVAPARVPSQLGQLTERLTNALGQGINGVSWQVDLTDPRGGAPKAKAAAASTTQGGQAGWSPSFLPWDSQLTGGSWNKLATITAPANAVGLETGASQVVTLLSLDPAIEIFLDLLPVIAGTEDRHLHAGDGMQVVATVMRTDTMRRITPDVGTVTAILIRYNIALTRFEYLAADKVTWVAWTGISTPADTIPLTDAGDGLTFTLQFTTTGGWTSVDVLAVAVAAKVGGTPYKKSVPRELVAANNDHDRYVFDAVGFALNGSGISFK